GLGPRQHLGHIVWRQRFVAPDRLAHGALVKPWRFGDEAEPSCFQQLRPRLARRSEDQRWASCLQEARCFRHRLIYKTLRVIHVWYSQRNVTNLAMWLPLGP